MRKNKNNILLILDNAPCHKTYPMSNIHIAFLLLDYTGVLQPLDASMYASHSNLIIDSIKSAMSLKKSENMIFFQSFYMMLFAG